MAGLILDAGPLIGWERGDRQVAAWLREAQHRGAGVAVCAATIAEVWRGGPRSARTAMLLRAVEVLDVDQSLARQAGELLSAVGGDHTLDAFVVACAQRVGARVLTSDPGDVAPLAERARVPLSVLRADI